MNGGRTVARLAPAAIAVVLLACGDASNGGAPAIDASIDALVPIEDAGAGDASIADAGDASHVDAAVDASSDARDAANQADSGLAPDRFVTSVVSFDPGPCGGFGASLLPGVVLGPPVGGGDAQGGLDVVSLGVGGAIVLSFAPNAIVDGPGADFIVFENAFYLGGNPKSPYAEPAEVSISDDGSTWSTYPCTATAYPYGACAGTHPVYSAPGNGISPVDPATAGGDAYDLADLGVAKARFVRIRDKSNETCPDAGGSNAAGFDLDAVSIVNAAIP